MTGGTGAAAARIEPAHPAAPPAPGGVRPMTRDDIPAVAAMFEAVFARGRPTGHLPAYIETVFFGSPHYSEEHGSVVYDDGRTGVSSAVLSLPMPFSIHGETVMARLVCAFMSDGSKASVLGAARIARSLWQSQVEMCFSDSSSPTSANHCTTSGGIVLPVESLEWRRVFLPLSAAALNARHGRPRGFLPAVAPLRLLDRLVLAWKPSIRPRPAAGCSARAAPLSAFLDCAGSMTERFAVRPVWSQADFDWLTRTAALNTGLGRLQCRVVEKAGQTLGAFLFFGRPGQTACVMNVLCDEGYEFDVVGQMFACLAEEGYALASGIAQPFTINAVMRQRQLTFKHRGYFCLSTRRGDLVEAARKGDIYIGGLASESWSRLVTDF